MEVFVYWNWAHTQEQVFIERDVIVNVRMYTVSRHWAATSIHHSDTL